MAEIHAAETAANKKLNPDGTAVPKPELWWSEEHGSATVDGILQRFECQGRLGKLVIDSAGGSALQLLVRNPAQITVSGGGAALACGPQRPARHVSVSYNPKVDKRLGTAGEVVSVEFR